MGRKEVRRRGLRFFAVLIFLIVLIIILAYFAFRQYVGLMPIANLKFKIVEFETGNEISGTASYCKIDSFDSGVCIGPLESISTGSLTAIEPGKYTFYITNPSYAEGYEYILGPRINFLAQAGETYGYTFAFKYHPDVVVNINFAAQKGISFIPYLNVMFIPYEFDVNTGSYLKKPAGFYFIGMTNNRGKLNFKIRTLDPKGNRIKYEIVPNPAYQIINCLSNPPPVNMEVLWQFIKDTYIVCRMKDAPIPIA